MRAIDDQDAQLGIISLTEALALAETKSLDLVEIAPNAEPPVVRVMDFGKYKYEQEKQRDRAKKSRAGQVKEIRLSMKIGQHDLLYRLERAKKFLEEGNKVRFNLMMKGRENANPNAAKDRIKQFAGLLEGVQLEAEPTRAGRSISAIVTLAKKTARAPDVKQEPKE